MKRVYISTFLLVIISLLISCNNDSKYNELIVGQYYSIEYIEDLEWDEELPISLTIETYEEFFSDQTSVEEGTCKFSIYNENGNNIIIEYSIDPVVTHWKIEDSNLYYDYGVPEFPMKFKYSNASSHYEKETVKFFREFIENDFAVIWKQTIIRTENEPKKIIELNKDRLITEDIDGEIITQKKIKDQSLEMEKRFIKDGLSFNYPNSWIISEEEDLNGMGYYVAVEKKGVDESGLFIVVWANQEVPVKDEIIETQNSYRLHKDFQNVKFEPIIGTSLNEYEPYTFSCNGYFTYLNELKHKIVINVFHSKGKTFRVIQQEAMEDSSKNEKDFNTIISSLKVE